MRTDFHLFLYTINPEIHFRLMEFYSRVKDSVRRKEAISYTKVIFFVSKETLSRLK